MTQAVRLIHNRLQLCDRVPSQIHNNCKECDRYHAALLAGGSSETIPGLSRQIEKSPMPTRRDLANAIRALSMDAVQKANSGHPGAPMGMADIAEVLWRDVLKFNPANPTWLDRDRFVLSNGHASMLVSSVLPLTG